MQTAPVRTPSLAVIALLLAAVVAAGVAFALLHFAMLGSVAGLHFEPRESTPYGLPWQPGISRLCVQGNQTRVTHRGVHSTSWDFLMPLGSPVHAARAGIVELVADGYPDHPGLHRGNQVHVRHDDGSTAIYAHLRSSGMRVFVGQPVEQGDVLGEAGLSGRTLYPHLHFQVRDAAGEPLPASFRDVDTPDGVPRMWGRYAAVGSVP